MKARAAQYNRILVCRLVFPHQCQRVGDVPKTFRHALVWPCDELHVAE